MLGASRAPLLLYGVSQAHSVLVEPRRRSPDALALQLEARVLELVSCNKSQPRCLSLAVSNIAVS